MYRFYVFTREWVTGQERSMKLWNKLRNDTPTKAGSKDKYEIGVFMGF